MNISIPLFSLAWIFGSHGAKRRARNGNQGLGLLFFTNNKLYFDLKISEFSVTSVAKKISKTKPIQSQNKPKQSQFFGGFWRKNFNFSLKIDDTKLNFLCKTKPILLFNN